MSMVIDIRIEGLHPDTDINTLGSYIAALLGEQTGTQVISSVIDTEFVNPIKLAKSIRMQPNLFGSDH